MECYRYVKQHKQHITLYSFNGKSNKERYCGDRALIYTRRGPLALRAKKKRACKSGVKKTNRVDQGGSDPSGGGEPWARDSQHPTHFP